MAILSLMIQSVLQHAVMWKYIGEYGAATHPEALNTISMSAVVPVAFLRMTPAPMAPTTRLPITNPITATVTRPPLEEAVARYVFSINPVFAFRKARTENRTTRNKAGRTDIVNQNPLSAGFEALVGMFREKSKARTIPVTGAKM